MRSSQKEPAIQLTIESRLENVPLAGVAVNRICLFLEFDELEAGHLELCVVEAVTNCIRHAYRDEPGHEVSVGVEVHEDRVEFHIRDRGVSLSPTRLEEPRLEYDPADLEALPVGGMGLFIMHHIMDRVDYATRYGVNTLTLVRRKVDKLVSS